MTDEAFKTWATGTGLDPETIEALLDCAATPEQAQAAFNARMPGPPIFPLEQIVNIHDSDGYEMNPSASGFVLIGGCPNGDSIAVSIAGDPGSIWYIDHETVGSGPLKQHSVRVGDNLRSVYHSLTNDPSFPIDYYRALTAYDG